MRDWDLTALPDGTVLRFHAEAYCLPPCPLHAPTDHHMNTWRLAWWKHRGIMARVCEHLVGHPDPDNIQILAGADDGHHARCDGCCTPPTEEE